MINHNYMKFRILLLSTAMGLMAMACGKEPAPQPAPEKMPIKLSASLYQFTKATDTSFENGDEISVNIFNPECYLYNAKYTYTDGALTSAIAHQWYEDTDIEATITAVYPGSDTMEGYAENQSFVIQADQSSKTGYGMSDLMLAVTRSKPTAEAVKLPFQHALSKVVINIDNQLKENIENVWFTDVQGEVSYKTADPVATLAATGSTGTVKAYKSGESTWQLIIAPQTASPKLALTTASGKQYTFVLSEEVTFASGKVSTATVEVSAETIYTSFTPEISDWVADNDLNFSQKDDEEVVLPEEPEISACKLTVRVNKAIDWYDKYVYAWDASSTLTAAWPGTKAEWDKEDGDYYVYYHNFDASLNGATINYIINNGSNAQTNDLTVTLNGAETVVVIEDTDVK